VALKLARLFRATAIGVVCLSPAPIAMAGAEASRIDARERARQARVNIETAAERRRVARLAHDAQRRNRGVDEASVIARFGEVVRLDPNVHSDWTTLRDLYHFSSGGNRDRRAKAVHARRPVSGRKLAASWFDDSPECNEK
jgi:hypothetical protein